MLGDKLYSILEPNAVEVQLRKLKREVKSIKNRPRAIPEGRNPERPRTPVPDPTEISVSVAYSTSLEGAQRPVITVGPASTTQYYNVRGLQGYDVLLTHPSGEQELVGYRISDETRNTPATTIPLPQPTATASQTYYIQVRLVSSIYGTGEWSEQIAVSVDPPSAAPAAPTGLAVTALVGQYLFTWDAPTDHLYDHSDIFLVNGLFAGTEFYVGSTRGNKFLLPWSQTNWGTGVGAYNQVDVRHVSRANNSSSPASASLGAPSLVDANQIASSAINDWHIVAITTPAKYAPHTSPTAPFGIYDDGTNPSNTPIERGQIYFSEGGQTLVLSGVRDTANSLETGIQINSTRGDVIYMPPDGSGINLSSSSDIQFNVPAGFTIHHYGDVWFHGKVLGNHPEAVTFNGEVLLFNDDILYMA